MVKAKTVVQHESNYFHVPKFSSIGLLGVILFGFLSYINFFGIIELWGMLDLGNLTIYYKTYSFSDLLIIPSLFLEYFFVCCFFVSIVLLIKGKINSFKEEGLLLGLVGGLIGGLIIGLIIGLIEGLIIGLITGLIFGLITGLITGLIIGLIGGLSEKLK